MNRIYFSLLISIISYSGAFAQVNEFMVEEFKDPSVNWNIGKQKKVKLEATSGNDGYKISNEDSKADGCILLKKDFDNTKSYRMEFTIERNLSDGNGYNTVGLMLDAKDEKNGFAFVINGYNSLAVYQIKSGKKEVLLTHPFNKTYEYYQKELGTPGAKVKLKVLLTPTRWHLFIDDKLMFDFSPWPLMGKGTKAGLFISNQNDFRILEARISEGNSDEIVNDSQPFKRDELQWMINKIFCAASKNFEPLVGNKSDVFTSINGRDTWEMKLEGMPEKGARVVTSIMAENSPWQKRAIIDVYTGSREQAELLLEQYRDWLYAFRSPCSRELKMLELDPNSTLPSHIIREIDWEGNFDSERVGKDQNIILMLRLIENLKNKMYSVKITVYYTY